MRVYKVTNVINNKLYVGRTSKTISKRFSEHLGIAKSYNKRSILLSSLHNAILKYGSNKFIIECIEECKSLEHSKEREIYWIAFYRSNKFKYGYNMTKGGDGGTLGFTGRAHSERTKEKMRNVNPEKRASNKGKTLPIEWKRNISIGCKGLKKPKGFGEKIRAARIGKHLSEETKAKLRIINLGRKKCAN